MSNDIFQGYKGEALEVLKKYQVRVWGTTKVDTTRGFFGDLRFGHDMIESLYEFELVRFVEKKTLGDALTWATANLT